MSLLDKLDAINLAYYGFIPPRAPYASPKPHYGRDLTNVRLRYDPVTGRAYLASMEGGE